jgi:type IV secretion system protein TrbB
LIRVEQLIAEASTAPMGELIGEAVNVIVSIAKTAEGRKVKEVLFVKGYHDGQYVFEDAETGSDA